VKRILILGGSGMLGHKLYNLLNPIYDVYVTIRGSVKSYESFKIFDISKVRDYVDALDFDSVIRAMAAYKPDIVINCIGLIKQLPRSSDPLWAITVNAQLPHRISLVCAASNIRMIHISTDCVFSGKKGNYNDDDISDAEDLYGKTKYLGEVAYKPHTITLRTSIIGRELNTKYGLVEWFLSQNKSIEGYKNAIFSGFTTEELSMIIANYVIPNESLTGIYNVSSEPISKYELLNIIKRIYKKEIEILPDTKININRSLNSAKFRKETGYNPQGWEKMILDMKNSNS
jgi:dTDP-4-dehydrorhamnose reductase